MEIPHVGRFEHLTPLDEGFTAQCFTDGKTVSKIIKAGQKEKSARAKLETLRGEYDRNRLFLGENTLESDFFLEQSPGGYIVRIEQPHTRGTPLRQSLDSRNPAQREFFQRSLRMYAETGLVPDLLPDIMPDLSGGVYFTGRYTYGSGPNVFLVQGNPILVDTTLNRSLRSSLLGPPLRALVARRIRLILG